MSIDRTENTVNSKKQKRHSQQQSPADRQLRFEPLEVRLLLASDFADALSPYPTTLVEDGAQHEAISWTLGDTSDIETDGTHSAVADGDGANHQNVTELNIDLNIPGSPGNVTTVSVELGDVTGAISATFNVLYDDAVLSITNDDVKHGSLWPQTDGWSLAKNTAIAGQVRVVMFNVSSTATGPGEIAQLDFTVKAGAASGSTLLDIEPVDPNEGGLQWTDSDGSILVNHAPTLDAISDVTIDEDSPEQTVNLTGITAGGGESQLLAVTAVSSNTGVVPNPTAAYTSASSAGSLMFTPQPDQNGTATITVTVEDAGFDGDFATTNDNGTFSRTFEVTVSPVNDAPTGTVTISGTASEDQTLTANNTLADKEGLGAISYTWSNGATGGSIVLDQSDVGNPITVTASYTDGLGTAESVTSDPTAAVANVNDAPTGTVTISGTASEDQTLTANNTLADEDGLGAISYTWSNGATGGSIVLGQSDVGNAITVTASYTDAQGTAESVTSDPTAAIANVNDAPTALADAITVGEGETNAVLDGGATSVLANDSDVDSANLTAVLVTDVANGALTLNSDGTFSYTHDDSKTTSDSFTYKANDGALDSNTVMVTVTVNPAPPNVTLVTRDSGNDTFDTLDTLAFTFDTNVNVTAGALSLLNETAGGTAMDLTGVGFDYHAASMTATWDLTGVAGIDAAFYTGLLDATLITDSFGNLLDGDGDGTAGDDFSHVLLVAKAGDSDLDGDVDLTDYSRFATNFDPTGINSPHEWCDANFDTDLDIDVTDYLQLSGNFAPSGYAGTTPSLYVAPGCGVGSEPLAAASLAVADAVEPENEISSAMRIDVPANALLPTSPERLLSKSPGFDQVHDTQATITVGRPARRQAVCAAFAQYESDRQAFGKAASSDSSASPLDLSLAEYLDQRESEHVRKLFAK
ncbi:MAG: hypothetical protein CMJ81_16420 [Planctomycetaceae bacterium]|nr:hypothetical protein [Planctomycetaceae bacterium]